MSAVMFGAAVVSDSHSKCYDCMISGKAAAVVLAVPLIASTSLVGGFIGLNFRDRWSRINRP